MLLADWSEIPKAKHAVLIFMISLYGGFRLSEVLKLRKDSVNLTDETFDVHDTKGGTPKTVEMNETLTKLIKEAMKESNYFHSAESNFVFTNPQTEKPYTTIKNRVNNALMRVELSNFTFHHTRHTFRTRLQEAGVDDTTIMEQGGWKTRAMLDRYSHTSRKHKKEAMKKLDRNRTDFVTDFYGVKKDQREENITIRNMNKILRCACSSAG